MVDFTCYSPHNKVYYRYQNKRPIYQIKARVILYSMQDKTFLVYADLHHDTALYILETPRKIMQT